MAKIGLQERMTSLKPYVRGIEMYNDALIVNVTFPDKWRVSNSADDKIKVAPSETKANEYFYYANSNDAAYDDILDLVEETVKMNQEVLLKLKLLREKVEELKELFSENSYDALKTLSFALEEPKKEKPKRKYSKKKKTPQNENMTPSLEDDKENKLMEEADV